jgi:hypothetical protein
MLIILLLLSIIAFASILLPIYLSFLGQAVPDYIFNLVGSFTGAIFAIVGSVSFQLLTERNKNKRIYYKHLQLLMQELYDNFIVCLYRISERSEDIDYFDGAYKDFISASAAYTGKDKKRIDEDISKLYFIISRGHQTLKTFKSCYNTAIDNTQKKPQNFKEVQEIVQSVGIDYVYEFAILRQIILLNRTYHLGIALPYDDFEKIVKHGHENEINMEDAITSYISEQVCKIVFKNDRIVYYDYFLHEKEY